MDYDKLGFKCGLEIHQQLEGEKLFCKCKTLNSQEKGDVKFERKLVAVVGETGEVDVAAAHEMEKGKKFFYEGNSEDTCLVDYDEEPPGEMNEDSLDVALKVALLLNAKIVDEVQVMRKIVVDGSNVSGFQRTSLVAVDGYIETSRGKVGVPLICLEEEACQKLVGSKEQVRYKLDRLGIPLIEIATDASVKDADHAKEVAGYIGMVLRSIPGVKRGLGTIRQDVNVCISKGERVEVKGFQDLKSIPKVIEFEINRQLGLVGKGKKVDKEVRKAENDFTTSFLRPMPGAARLYPETDCLPKRVSKEYINNLKKNLPRLMTERIGDFKKKYNLNDELAKEAIHIGYYENFVKQFGKVDSNYIAKMLIVIPKEIKKKDGELDSSKLGEKDFEEVLSYLNSGKITKEAVIDVLISKILGEKVELEKYSSVKSDDVEAKIKEIVDGKPGLNIGAYMGLVMKEFRGRVEGKKVMEILKKYVK